MDALTQTPWLAWATFFTGATLVIYAGSSLSRLGDALADRTGLGRVWIGTLLLAGATSLPEVSTSGVAGLMGLPDLAVGNVFGSNIFNMAILAVAQFATRQPILATASSGHFVTAAAGLLLSGLAAMAVLVRVPVQVLGLGLDTLVILAVYAALVRMLPREDGPGDDGETAAASNEAPIHGGSSSAVALWAAFALAAAGVVAGGTLLSYAGEAIAAQTGWGQSFVGNTLLAASTSLPELTVSIAAVTRGSVDLAVGNVLGSNIFNMVILAVSDLAYRGETGVLSAVSPSQAISALLGLLLSALVVLGMSLRQGRRQARVQWDTTAILLTYLTGSYLIFVTR